MFAKTNTITFSPHRLKLPTLYTGLSYIDKKAIRGRYIELQKGSCYYCKGDLNFPAKTFVTDREINKSLFPEGFFDHPIHLHHSHDTDLTIGVTHAYCNAVLWVYEGE